MQLDPEALEAVKGEIQRFHRNSCYPEALDVELEVAAKRILQAVQPVPVATTITAATIEKACTDPIEIWPTGWRETYPALASPNVGTVKARLLAALTATASAEPVAWQTEDETRAITRAEYKAIQETDSGRGAYLRKLYPKPLYAAPLPAQGSKADD